MSKLVIDDEYLPEWWEEKNYNLNSWQQPAREERIIEGVKKVGTKYIPLKDIIWYEEDQVRSDDNLDERENAVYNDFLNGGFRPDAPLPQVVIEGDKARISSSFARNGVFKEILLKQPEAVYPFDIFEFESKYAEIQHQISINDHGPAFKNTDNDLINGILKLHSTGRIKHDKKDILDKITILAPNYGSKAQKEGLAKRIYNQIEKEVVANHIVSFSDSKLREAVNNICSTLDWSEFKYSNKKWGKNKRLMNENEIEQRVIFGKTSEYDQYFMRDFFTVLENPNHKEEILLSVKDKVSSPEGLKQQRQSQYDKFLKCRNSSVNILMRESSLTRKEAEKKIDGQVKVLGWIAQDLTNEVSKGVSFISLNKFLDN